MTNDSDPLMHICHLSYQPYSHPALMFDLTDNKMFKGLIAWNIFFLINFNKTVFLHYQKPSCCFDCTLIDTHLAKNMDRKLHVSSFQKDQ